MATKTNKAGCPDCGATGFQEEDTSKPFCKTCNGSSVVQLPPEKTKECPDCNGRGHVENVPCHPCAHTGKRSLVERKPDEPEPPTIEDLERLQADMDKLSAKFKEQKEYIAELETENKTLAADNKKLQKQLKEAAKPKVVEAPVEGASTEAAAPPASEEESAQNSEPA